MWPGIFLFRSQRVAFSAKLDPPFTNSSSDYRRSPVLLHFTRRDYFPGFSTFPSVVPRFPVPRPARRADARRNELARTLEEFPRERGSSLLDLSSLVSEETSFSGVSFEF